MSWYQLDAHALDEHLLEDCWRLCRDLHCVAKDTSDSCAIFERPRADGRTIFFAPHRRPDGGKARRAPLRQAFA